MCFPTTYFEPETIVYPLLALFCWKGIHPRQYLLTFLESFYMPRNVNAHKSNKRKKCQLLVAINNGGSVPKLLIIMSDWRFLWILQHIFSHSPLTNQLQLCWKQEDGGSVTPLCCFINCVRHSNKNMKTSHVQFCIECKTKLNELAKMYDIFFIVRVVRLICT